MCGLSQSYVDHIYYALIVLLFAEKCMIYSDLAIIVALEIELHIIHVFPGRDLGTTWKKGGLGKMRKS